MPKICAGLYFQIPHDLRLNYVSGMRSRDDLTCRQARFWLSLLSPPTEKNRQDRQKYASLVGGEIGPERVGATPLHEGIY